MTVLSDLPLATMPNSLSAVQPVDSEPSSIYDAQTQVRDKQKSIEAKQDR